MGYTTEFHGTFKLDKPLTQEQYDYLIKFSGTRRMCRNVELTKNMPDTLREAVGLPLGTEGEFFVGAERNCGQDETDDIVDYNHPPSTQPGVWCQWIPSPDRLHIEWNGGEKFYNYIDWINYIIQKFLTPWGLTLNGTVTWQGEDREDRGKIVIINNTLKISD